MNFNKIVKSMQRLDEEHKRIQKRFSTKKKNTYVYQRQLKEVENEDLRIFGHTQANVISKFREKHYKSTYAGSKSQKFIGEKSVVSSERNIEDLKELTKGIGIKSVSLNKTRVRPKTHILQSYSKKGQGLRLWEKKDLFMKNESCHFSNKKSIINMKNEDVRKMSVMRYRDEFNETFEINLLDSKLLGRKQKISKYKEKIFVNQPEELSVNLKITHQNFFLLTQEQEKIEKKGENFMGEQNLMNEQQGYLCLKKLNNVIFENFPTYFLGEQRKTLKKGWGQNWKSLYSSQDSRQLRFYLISIFSLEIREISLSNMNVLHEIIQKILKDEKMLHFCIIREGQNGVKLIYEQFLLCRNYSLQYYQLFVWVFRYYFKRFLLFGDQYVSIKDLNRQQKIFFEGKNKTPQGFYEFIHDLKQKSYVIMDYRKNKRSGNLGLVLEECYKEIQLRAVNWGKKSMKFYMGCGGKENKMNKQTYFYICFFLQFKKSFFKFFFVGGCFFQMFSHFFF